MALDYNYPFSSPSPQEVNDIIGGTPITPAGGLSGGQVPTSISDYAYELGYSVDKFITDPTKRADVLRARSDGYVAAVEVNAAVQSCQRNGRPLRVIGRVRVDDTVFINPLDGAQFASFMLMGEGAGYDTSAGLGGSKGQSVIVGTMPDRPVISINNARGVTIRDLSVAGVNTAPASITLPTYSTAFGFTDYVTPGCLDNQYGAHALIDVDGFSGANPGGGQGYTSQTAKYLNTAAGSANVLLWNLYLEKGVVGILCNPSKFGVQGDMSLFGFITTRMCKTGIAFGESQSIGSMILQFYPQSSMLGLSGRMYGRQQGALNSVKGGQAVLAYALFDMPIAFNTLSIDDFYMENCMTMGAYGVGANSLKYPLKINGGRYAFGSPTMLPAHCILECHVGAHFNSVAFQHRNTPIDECFNFYGSNSADFIFDNCMVSHNSGDVTRFLLGVLKDYAGGPRIQKRGCYFKNAGQVSVLSDRQPRRFSLPPRVVADYFTREVADTTFYDYVAGVTNSYENVAFTGGTWSFGAASLTWTGTPTTDMQLGQLYFYAANSRMSGLAMTLPNLKVSQVNPGVSVVFDLLKQASEYDQAANPVTLPRYVQEHASGAACTASINNDTSLTLISLTTYLQNGDRIKLSSGDPGGLILISGAGTATGVLNKAASAIASGVKVFLGKLQTRAAGTDKF
jgi:hypothetical protein